MMNLKIIDQKNEAFKYQFEFVDHILYIYRCYQCGLIMSNFYDPEYKKLRWVKWCRNGELPKGQHEWILDPNVKGL